MIWSAAAPVPGMADDNPWAGPAALEAEALPEAPSFQDMLQAPPALPGPGAQPCLLSACHEASNPGISGSCVHS